MTPKTKKLMPLLLLLSACLFGLQGRAMADLAPFRGGGGSGGIHRPTPRPIGQRRPDNQRHDFDRPRAITRVDKQKIHRPQQGDMMQKLLKFMMSYFRGR